MSGKMLKAGPFLGKDRKAGDIITDDELELVTQQTKTALVNTGIMEIDGMGSQSTGVDAATKELISQLFASVDRLREANVAQFEALHIKLDALSGTKPAAAKKRNKGR